MQDIMQVEDKDKLTSRCLRILVFYKLKPIHELGGVELSKGWLDCFRCMCKSSIRGIPTHQSTQVIGRCEKGGFIIVTLVRTT
jgi:hypothetical protein